MSLCSQLWEKLTDACCRPRARTADDSSEHTRLTVKCQNRYVSDENLLDNGWSDSLRLPKMGRSSPAGSDNDGGAGRPGWPPLRRSGLSVSEAQLDRVQPPSSTMYRPDLDHSSHSVSSCDSLPEASATSTGSTRPTQRICISRKSKLKPEMMQHAQTIADISKSTLRDLKERNKSGAGVHGSLARASRLGLERSQYESTGSLTADGTATLPSPQSLDDSNITDELYGSVSLTASFSPHQKRLILQLEGVNSLPPRGENGLYRPATELTLLPEVKPIKQAPYHGPADLNPRYKAQWALPLKPRELASKTLRVSVFDAARRGPYEAIGHALLPLQDTVSESPQRFLLPLGRRSMLTEPLGRVLVSLSYRSSNDRLSVVIMQARQLRVSPAIHKLPHKTFQKHAAYHTFAKASLRCGGEKVKTKRSEVVHGSREPFYNTGFDFVLPQGFVEDASLVVSVVMRGPMRTDLVVGRTILGPFFCQQGGKPTQWGRALTAGEVATQWHRLYL